MHDQRYIPLWVYGSCDERHITYIVKHVTKVLLLLQIMARYGAIVNSRIDDLTL